MPFGSLKKEPQVRDTEADRTESPHVLLNLPSEDLDLVAHLVLHSGSLKDLASEYGVSYPTIRSRLDKVIERLRAAMAGKKPDPISELLATLVERGEVTPGTARSVRALVRKHCSEGDAR